MAIKPEILTTFGRSREELSFVREMGVEYLNLIVPLEKLNRTDLGAEVSRIGEYGLSISDLSCLALQKCPEIILNLPGREEKAEQFREMIALAGELKIPLVSVAWQPNGIFRTGKRAGEHTRGGVGTYADLDEILSRPLSNGRVYSREEIWDSFAWFLEQVLPVCDETGVRMALHPSDPPVESLGGTACLIQSAADYRHALELAGDSRGLSVKMCVGCWLEKPSFGDLLEDIRYFVSRGELTEVHFRNVSAPLPKFEEVLNEDGYGDMIAVMRTLVFSGFDGFISVDHAYEGYPSMGGRLGAYAYPTGYMKGLLHMAERECGQR